MTKEIVRAKDGFEKIYDILVESINEIEEEKNVAIENAKLEIEAKFSERLNAYNEELNRVKIVETIEIPDEEIVSESENVNSEEINTTPFEENNY